MGEAKQLFCHWVEHRGGDVELFEFGCAERVAYDLPPDNLCHACGRQVKVHTLEEHDYD